MLMRLLLAPVAAAGLASVAATPPAVALKPATLAAFDRYVRLTEARIVREVNGRAPFLWIDRQPPAERRAFLDRLARGEVVSEQLETRDEGREIEPDGGMIHHWIGTVLLPRASLSQTRSFVQEYERYPSLFMPTIQRARVLSRSGDRFTVQMRTAITKIITVVIDADYQIEYQTIDPTRLHVRSRATNLYQVDSPGEPDERRIPVDQSNGFLWRLNMYCSFEQTALGTIEQCESVSLTRGIPFGLAWLVRPYVTSIPREALEFTLGKVRAEVGKP